MASGTSVYLAETASARSTTPRTPSRPPSRGESWHIDALYGTPAGDDTDDIHDCIMDLYQHHRPTRHCISGGGKSKPQNDSDRGDSRSKMAVLTPPGPPSHRWESSDVGPTQVVPMQGRQKGCGDDP